MHFNTLKKNSFKSNVCDSLQPKNKSSYFVKVNKKKFFFVDLFPKTVSF